MTEVSQSANPTDTVNSVDDFQAKQTSPAPETDISSSFDVQGSSNSKEPLKLENLSGKARRALIRVSD